MHTLNVQEQTTLEQLIDGSSLGDVLDALSEICDEKVAHIRENWQDFNTCKPWERMAHKLSRIAIQAKIEKV